MPLLKGALKDDTKSKNYRAIAISALLLKVLDNVILILYGDLLQSSNLQFGYKKNASGTQCSWMILEVVSYYLRHGTTVKAAWLDCTRAFDTCVFSTLFTKILDRGVPAIIVRGLLSIYRKQRCWVKWTANQSVSRDFGISNGTRQGSCLSPAIFAVYLDELLNELRASGVGCYVGDIFAGAGCFADDLAILAPTRDGLQMMLDITEDYARRHNLTFSTDPDPAKSKTKGMFFHAGREENPAEVTLCGRNLRWVDRADHLGHVIHCSGSQDLDCNIARGVYIGTSNEILNMFTFANAAQKLTAVQTYSCAWYGSMLWDLYSNSANKAYRSWNTTVKMSHNLPRQTRTFIVENYLSPLPSVKQIIIRRYVQYLQSLLSSPNPIICQIAHLAVNTTRSVTGKNVKNIRDEFQLDPLVENKRLFFVNKKVLPLNGQDTIELLDYLLYLRDNETEDDAISELQEVINNVCSA